MRFKIILFIAFFFGLFSIYSQQSISGRIIGEDLELPINVRIFDSDSTLLGETDFDGKFNIKLPEEKKILLFASLGYDWTNILVTEDCRYIEVVILESVIYDFMTSNRIDRLRKKRFEKIPELHSQAFEKGVFKTKKKCFKREFKPIKPRLDRIASRNKELTKENKKKFEALKVGDTITIPFSGSFKYDGTERTALFVYSYLIEGDNFDCKIEGILTKKTKNRKGYFLIYKVNDISKCNLEEIYYNNKPVKVGQILEQNMKYFKVITQ